MLGGVAALVGGRFKQGVSKQGVKTFVWRTGMTITCLGAVPTTPDPNTSAKASRYKLEAYRDTNWWCI